MPTHDDGSRDEGSDGVGDGAAGSSEPSEQTVG
jgi:hypothetical protein